MDTIAYRISAGSFSIDSAADPRTELLAVDVRRALNEPGDHGRLALYVTPAAPPSPLEQAVGAAAAAAGSALGLDGGGAGEAFSIDVRGQKVKLGDPITIELAVGGTTTTVLTADIVSIRSDFGRTTITARTAGQRLAETRLSQAYQNQTLGQIVKDLCGQAGVQAGDVEDGSRYPYFAVHESRSLWRTVRELAAREGMDVYVDAENRLTVKTFAKTEPDHTLFYGIDLLDLDVINRPPVVDRLLVCGESPASNQGADAWPWLAKDIGPFQAEIGQGARTLTLQDGALRTKDAAASAAKARFGAMKDASAHGRLKVLGRPGLGPGDAVMVKNAPKPEMNGLFKITSARHVYDKRQGYVTYAAFSGQGGAAEAGDLLGQLGGALAGAIGL